MRKIKAHIKTSPEKNLFYKLYRDVSEIGVPESSDLLAVENPIVS